MNGGRCNNSSMTCECLPEYVLGDCSWCYPREETNQCLQHFDVECLNTGHYDTLTNIYICAQNYTGSYCSICIPEFMRTGVSITVTWSARTSGLLHPVSKVRENKHTL